MYTRLPGGFQADDFVISKSGDLFVATQYIDSFEEKYRDLQEVIKIKGKYVGEFTKIIIGLLSKGSSRRDQRKNRFR